MLILLYLVFITLYLKSYSNNIDQNPISHKRPTVIIGYKIPDISDTKRQIKGYYSEGKETIGVVHLNDTIAIVELDEPSIVAIADKEYPWGWFQFPVLGVSREGHIIVRWSMRNDSAEEYGKPNDMNSYRISFDGGMTWEKPTKNQIFPINSEVVDLPEVGYLAIKTLPTEDISFLSEFPLPIFKEGETDFYRDSDLPNKFRGIYETYTHNNSTKSFHAKVNNEGLIRAVTNNKIFTVWFGKLLMSDRDIYACVYPTHYLDMNGKPTPIAITCYKTSDLGETWNIQGKIDYTADVKYKTDIGINKRGFTEPTFEFLKDDEMLCVMRTSAGKADPMYKSYSNDLGVTWSTPVPIAPNGVMPRLTRLYKDVLLLASGRPGIQIRLSFDGKGNYWSDPIELIDYDENENWVFNSCGYPSIHKVSDNEVYIVYSNFRNKSTAGAYRKSIIFRRIKIYRLGES